MFSNRRAGGKAAGLAVVAVFLLAACGGDDSRVADAPGDCPSAPIPIVVSVSQWADIVRSLAGDCGQVTTIISGTSVDPHDYEPVPADLAAFGDAHLVVVNGLGYDAWAVKAIDSVGQKAAVVDAGKVLGKSSGDNPHVWYGPDFVSAVADAVTTQLETLAPSASSYFEARSAAWTAAMQPYYDEVSELGATIAGSKAYAATEPVFDYMAQALGLTDKTPRGFARSAANGSEAAPGDIRDFESVLHDGAVDILVFNTQTKGSLPSQLRSAANAAHIPVVEVTEAPPTGDTFVSWQVGQLQSLRKAITG